jgi:hypothetical protein
MNHLQKILKVQLLICLLLKIYFKRLLLVNLKLKEFTKIKKINKFHNLCHKRKEPFQIIEKIN